MTNLTGDRSKFPGRARPVLYINPNPAERNRRRNTFFNRLSENWHGTEQGAENAMLSGGEQGAEQGAIKGAITGAIGGIAGGPAGIIGGAVTGGIEGAASGFVSGAESGGESYLKQNAMDDIGSTIGDYMDDDER